MSELTITLGCNAYDRNKPVMDGVQPTFSSVRTSTSEALAQTGDAVSAWMREARSELQLRGNHAAQLSNDLLQKLEDTLTLPTRNGEATRNGDPDDNS